MRQADIDDGVKAGVTTDEQARMRALEQEVRELKRANEILKRAASFFGAELGRFWVSRNPGPSEEGTGALERRQVERSVTAQRQLLQQPWQPSSPASCGESPRNP